MTVRVATFKLNNLFSHFNFQGEVAVVRLEAIIGKGGASIDLEVWRTLRKRSKKSEIHDD